jgi:hypothetical protein
VHAADRLGYALAGVTRITDHQKFKGYHRLWIMPFLGVGTSQSWLLSLKFDVSRFKSLPIDLARLLGDTRNR